MSQAPWYKRFAADLMSDPFVQAMTDEQYAWYSKMLDLSWIATPQAFLPNAKDLLAKMVSKCEQNHFIEHSQIVFDRFQTSEDGLYIYHPKMLEQAEKVAKTSKIRKLAGSEGGKAKAKKRTSKRVASARNLPLDSDVDSDSDNKQVIALFISIPTKEGSDFGVTDQDVTQWATLFPKVDVRQELRSMRAWVCATTTRRKTTAGMKRFILGWLTRTNERLASAAPKPQGTGKSLIERVAEDRKAMVV